MGMPLAEVAQPLDVGGRSLQAILARQIGTLDREIARTQALRKRLSVVHSFSRAVSCARTSDALSRR
jgi:hypothetical protein